ncbi:MAG: hypothetical protein GX491_16485 [Chloroflexi bacterium]|nr:hypothetical protein [Chloroflexota bacterium]
MTEIARIARLFQQVIEGSPYYGPSTFAALKDITADKAIIKPAWSAHSIWDLVNHITAELQYAIRILEKTAEPWVAGQTTWPVQTDLSEAAWQKSLQDLKKVSRKLMQAISKLDDSILDQQAYYVECPNYFMLQGTLQHIIFHTGQISLLTGQFQ